MLWDCIPLLDDATVTAVRERGGLARDRHLAPALLHGDGRVEPGASTCPIYLHAADREWVMRPDPAIVLWEGETRELGDGLTLVRCGGHFDGRHGPALARRRDGRGALLAGDIVQVVPDRR